MPPEGELRGADRAIIYLEPATATLGELDAHREDNIRTEVRRFLSSPTDCFAKHPAGNLSQIRDIESNTRAFATWVQNSAIGWEMCVVLDVYKKTNEGDYWADLEDYDSNGDLWYGHISNLQRDQLHEWRHALQENPDVILVE